ncbi:MAG TPA: RodZ family helix-turn-helix domain-containing protein [Nostocaceae cyanobacterium]|nr:RodZ family helix-turn-helix domain-containing protein [Nostocaceae cyanobacterium]
MKWLQRKDEKLTKPSIEQQQAETLAQLGAKLSALRQEQGISLDELVVITRIPRRLLQAIEEGNLEDLPEPIYIQGLIRQFADAMGIKGVEFASNFPLGSPAMNLPSKWKVKPITQLRPIHLYLLYIFIIVCAVNSLSQLLNNAALQANNQIQPREQTQSSVKSETIASVSAAKPEVKIVDKKGEDQAVQIGVTLKASSWIRVVADGKTEFEGVLPEGSHRIWKAQQQLTVRTDNAGGVLMSVNQQEPKEMGEPGKVEEVRIAAETRD